MILASINTWGQPGAWRQARAERLDQLKANAGQYAVNTACTYRIYA
jgi:hypothetical protein